MNEKYQNVVSKVKERFPVESYMFRGDVNIIVDADAVIELSKMLRDELGFDALVDVTAVDYWPQQNPRFHLIYQLREQKKELILTIRIPLDGNFPEAHTLETIFPNANWYEREVWDLFGIKFIGHSDLRRLVLPNEWEGHPLRKDYPLGYEEVQYSFNKDEISKNKPMPRE